MSKIEASSRIADGNTYKILGRGVSSSRMNGVLKRIVQVLKKSTDKKPFFVVTAYSEFFLEDEIDNEFSQAWDKANLTVADGVSCLVAGEYLERKTGVWWRDLGVGLVCGRKVLSGDFFGKTVEGVKLSEKIIELAVTNRWKVFLLGGFGNTANELCYRLRDRYAGLQIDSNPGPQNLGGKIDENYELSQELKQKIAAFQPDILLVGLGRFKQEKWIARNLDKLRSRLIIGVGSTFDELLGIQGWQRKIPEWVEKSGLKWLWRVIADRKHVFRAVRIPVFAWKVYVSGLAK